MPIDRTGITDGSGKLVFDELPAGQYTISEIEAPAGYELARPAFQSISLTWGQTASCSFYDKPKTSLEVIKVDGKTNIKLPGAHFRLTDPTSGEFWEGETKADGSTDLGKGEGSMGNQIKSEMTYILTEIQAPPGYVLDPTPKTIVLSSNNTPNSYTFANLLKPKLTITKYDELTGKPVEGAHYKLWLTESETWAEGYTDAKGQITWTDLDEGIYSITEVDAPYGYFENSLRKEVLLMGGDHKLLEFFDRPRPVLIIKKHDQITGLPIPHTKFLVTTLEGKTIGEFETNEKGEIELSPKTNYLLDEVIYRVTEIAPPNQWLLSNETPNVVNTVGVSRDVMVKWYQETVLVFNNILKPTLIFTKIDGLTGWGVTNAQYKVEWDGPNGG